MVSALAIKFDKAGDWVSSVAKSYKKTTGSVAEGAPVSGRICEFTDDSNGFSVDEALLAYNDKNLSLRIKVIMQNAPSALPVKQNIADIKVIAISDRECEVIWSNSPELKTIGYVMYSVVRIALGKAFLDVLEELKVYVETGFSHPRKLKNLKK